MKNFRDFTYQELLSEVDAMGERAFRAEQIYAWVYRRGAASIDEMTDISKTLRDRLKEEYFIKGVEVLDVRTSSDGTKKFLSGLEDSSRIESVLIPEEDRLTLCVSSQAGCALNCRFCMTGKQGFTRNLTLSELTGQVFAAMGLIGKDERITNIVLMGMGEPLKNYDNVVRFLSVLMDGKGMGFSYNRVTLSTSGLVPEIKRLGHDSRVSLAVSLNATTDEVRERIMPINRKYPISELLKALREYPLQHKKYITMEYVLLKDVNDSLEDARRLAKMLRGITCKVNLIPFNPFPGAAFERPDERRVNAFHKIILDAGYTVIVRQSKGRDIEAACGQLKGLYQENGPDPWHIGPENN